MAPPKLLQLFRQVIEDQLSSVKPVYVATTLERLLAEGFSEDEAKNMMAAIVAHHMGNMINDDQPFNSEEYRRLLDQLPDFPENA